MKHLIYADNAATSQLNKKAYEAMKPFLDSEYGNPSQLYSFSRTSKKALKEARTIIADCIHANPNEIYFTSGGTESDNWAIKGMAFSLGKNKSILTSQIEHHAVLKSCEFLTSQGYNICYLPVNSQGIILEEDFKKALSANVGLASIMFANNEIGTVEPIKMLAQIAHKNGAIFHTDAVQAVGHWLIDVKENEVDLLSASAHKFGGPKGIGFLYIKDGINIVPFLDGGSQEKGFRAGTENVASVVGMAAALQDSCEQYVGNNEKKHYLLQLKTVFTSELLRLGLIEGTDYIINGCSKSCLPGLISVSFKNQNGEQIMHRLDLKGIMVSTGAACDSIKTEISHVINAINVPSDYAKGTIRISLGMYNTIEDVKAIAAELNEVMHHF